jgi:hypothetical protein
VQNAECGIQWAEFQRSDVSVSDVSISALSVSEIGRLRRGYGEPGKSEVRGQKSEITIHASRFKASTLARFTDC